MTRYARNLDGNGLIAPWLFLRLQEKNEKNEQYLLDVQSSRQKARNNARQPDTAEPRWKAILSV